MGVAPCDPASVSQALAQVGLMVYTRKSTRLTGHNADAVQAGHLQISQGDALMLAQAVNVDPMRCTVEYGRTFFVGARVELVLEASEKDATVM